DWLIVASKAPGIDLAVSELRVFPDPVVFGAPLHARFRVSNLGDGPSPATEAQLFADSREQNFFGRTQVPSLAPHASVELVIVSPPVVISPVRAPTALSVLVDAQHRIPEADRDNDEASVFVRVERPTRGGT